MPELTRREILALLLSAPVAASGWAQDISGSGAPWIPLFDGKSLDGWKASEHEGLLQGR